MHIFVVFLHFILAVLFCEIYKEMIIIKAINCVIYGSTNYCAIPPHVCDIRTISHSICYTANRYFLYRGCCVGSKHRRSQGVQWVHLHPQGGEKNFSGLIYRKNLKVHPQDTKCTSSQSKSQFLGQF